MKIIIDIITYSHTVLVFFIHLKTSCKYKLEHIKLAAHCHCKSHCFYHTCNKTGSNQKPDIESYKIHDAANHLEYISYQKYNFCVMSNVWPPENVDYKNINNINQLLFLWPHKLERSRQICDSSQLNSLLVEDNFWFFGNVI